MKGSSRVDSWLFAGGALALRLAVVVWAWGRVPPTADGKFYHVVAQRIAAGDGYTWLWPDGVVTYAAHYPVGYPALMALPYSIFGPVPGAVMVVNAIVGAWLVFFSHRLCVDAGRHFFPEPRVRLGAAVAAGLLAVSPTLVGYTPALMTEGAVAALLVAGAYFAVMAQGAQRSGERYRALFAVVLLSAGATFLRPQSVLFAPLFGVAALRGGLLKRTVAAAAVSLGCLAIVMPWTLRNCEKMERCVFVSANGGWNLLIGTFPEGQGAWVALDGERVPPECREVYQEAAKDECFGKAGVRRIFERPLRWLALIPNKLRATVDYSAAAADHLVESGALAAEKKHLVSYPEFALQRIGYLLALLGAGVCARRNSTWTKSIGIMMLIGVLGFLGLGAALGFSAILFLLLVRRSPLGVVGVLVGAFAIFSTLLIHAVFFGAGRYALPLLPLTAPLVGLGTAEVVGWLSYKSRVPGPAREV